MIMIYQLPRITRLTQITIDKNTRLKIAVELPVAAIIQKRWCFGLSWDKRSHRYAVPTIIFSIIFCMFTLGYPHDTPPAARFSCFSWRLLSHKNRGTKKSMILNSGEKKTWEVPGYKSTITWGCKKTRGKSLFPEIVIVFFLLSFFHVSDLYAGICICSSNNRREQWLDQSFYCLLSVLESE